MCCIISSEYVRSYKRRAARDYRKPRRRLSVSAKVKEEDRLAVRNLVRATSHTRCFMRSSNYSLFREHAVMKIVLFAGLSFCLLSAQARAQQASEPADSIQASPDFSFVTFDGQKVSSANLKGKVIVLDFWSTDCNPCRRSMPQLEKFYERYRTNPRVAFYLVNSGWESFDRAKAFADSKRHSFLFFSWGKRYDLPFAYDSGSVTLKAFGFDSNPSTVIIDARSRIRLRHSGYVESLKDFLVRHVESYLAEQ